MLTYAFIGLFIIINISVCVAAYRVMKMMFEDANASYDDYVAHRF
jgi:hypothetical protein